MHDWFSKTGQGVGSEYRYNFGGGSDGNFRAYVLNEQRDDAGRIADPRRERSYKITGAANELLPGRLRASARTSTTSRASRRIRRSTLDMNNASSNQRNFGGNVVGAWGTYSLNGTFDRPEYFYSQRSLQS